VPAHRQRPGAAEEHQGPGYRGVLDRRLDRRLDHLLDDLLNMASGLDRPAESKGRRQAPQREGSCHDSRRAREQSDRQGLRVMVHQTGPLPNKDADGLEHALNLHRAESTGVRGGRG